MNKFIWNDENYENIFNKKQILSQIPIIPFDVSVSSRKNEIELNDIIIDSNLEAMKKLSYCYPNISNINKNGFNFYFNPFGKLVSYFPNFFDYQNDFVEMRNMKIRTLLQSFLLLITLLTSTFTIVYYIFPGSFSRLDSVSQLASSTSVTYNSNENKYYFPYLPLTVLDYPEYSESGGVMFSENELPMSKSTVSVTHQTSTMESNLH
jgi:hypothetical protein